MNLHVRNCWTSQKQPELHLEGHNKRLKLGYCYNPEITLSVENSFLYTTKESMAIKIGYRKCVGDGI
jgi:hypothetical protein